MILAVAGPRPAKLGIGSWSGYIDNPLRTWIYSEICDVIRARRPLYGISGMAIGVDQLFAEACIDLKVPFIAAVPFAGQEWLWPNAAQVTYRALLAKAYEVVIVTEGPYERWKMDARNQWSVDHSNLLLAVWDGTSGGTANAVNYANRVGRDILYVNPNEFRAQFALESAQAL